MTYRQSEMYNGAKYLKNLQLQSVSSKGNLQVVGQISKMCELLLCSRRKRGRVGG